MLLRQQAETFLRQIQTRRRNPVKAATLSAYQSHLNSHILPVLGGRELQEVENGVLKSFVQGLSDKKLAAATITAVVSLVKQIVSSAIDTNGNQLFPRKWNNEFVDLPMINQREQDTPSATPEQIQQALESADNQDRALYALLAGTGLRVGEALSLKIGPDNGVDSFWQPETGVLTIRTTLVNGEIQTSTKTEAGNREVDLAPELNEFLKSSLSVNSGLLFTNQNGGPVRIGTAYEHLEKVGIPGFHSFRRFRCTHLDEVNVPQGLQRFWVGHAAGDVHESYIKMGNKIEERKEWAKRAGLGFQLSGTTA